MFHLTKSISLLLFVVCIANASISIRNDTASLAHLKRNVLLSWVAYCPLSQIRNWDCYWCKQVDRITITDYFVHPRDDSSSGFLGYNSQDGNTIQAHSIESWLVNLRTSQERNWPENVRGSAVHKGFYEAYMEIAPKVLDAVRRIAPQGKRIKIMGHSRGGAFGILAAAHLVQNGFAGRVDWMGFGIPRTGNREFSDYFKTIVPNSLRVVQAKDIVSRLPPSILLGFRHVTREVWFEKKDGPYKLCSETNAEDPTCSKGVLIPNIFDHWLYMGLDMKEGVLRGCV